MVGIRAEWLEIVTKTAVVIVDDHQIVRQGLRGLIEAQPDLAVVGEAETGAGALRCMACAARGADAMSRNVVAGEGGSGALSYAANSSRANSRPLHASPMM